MSDKTGKDVPRGAEPVGDPLIGKVLGSRYRLDSLLGSGAVGRVYAAEHVLMRKPLAVKILHAEHAKNRDIVLRFEREATAAANIDHANVVAATDFGRLEDGTTYLALELVQGKNLRAEVAHGAFGLRRALHVARQVASGLAAAHARSIVHRDLKPENIVLVDKDGDPDFVKVLDFGIAKLTVESGKSPLTKLGVVLGTFDYMAPEQALGQEVDARADLYALGVVLYEMISGACPFEGESGSAILQAQLTQRPPSFAKRAPGLAVPPAVEALVMKLLAKQREERPPSAAAVAAEILVLMSSLAPDAVAPPRPATTEKPSPAAPIPNKPTFLSSDPLPQFTFPPLEEESKKLALEVQAALAARALVPPPSKAPAAGAAVPPEATATPDGTPSPERVPAVALVPALRVHVERITEAILVWIDDHRRMLPRFVRRPLSRVSTPAIALVLIPAVALVVVGIVLLITGD